MTSVETSTSAMWTALASSCSTCVASRGTGTGPMLWPFFSIAMGKRGLAVQEAAVTHGDVLQ